MSWLSKHYINCVIDGILWESGAKVTINDRELIGMYLRAASQGSEDKRARQKRKVNYSEIAAGHLMIPPKTVELGWSSRNFPI